MSSQQRPRRRGYVDAGGSKSVYVTNTNTPEDNIKCDVRNVGQPFQAPGSVPYLRRYNFDFIPTSS